VCTGTAPASRPLVTGNPTAGTYVANPYFPFPYISTSFANPSACSSAVALCSRNSRACVSQLAGGAFSVSIEVPGVGGTTIAPSRVTTAEPSAAQICASLSAVACFGLESSECVVGSTANGVQIGHALRASPLNPITAAIPCLLVSLLAALQ
jgi:hypothetical protein